VIEDSTSEIQNLVSQKKFQQEENDLIIGDFASDPSMQRDYQTECVSCGHKESVYYMTDNIEKSQVILLHICCNATCGHYWKRKVEENDEGEEDY
jgi:DNA-directed RNA polymerase subunit M/transcription elongation factor TFIIS